MQIDRIEIYPLKVPLVKPFETALGTVTYRTTLLVRLFSGGAEGWGECDAFESPWYSSETTGGALRVIQKLIAPKILKVELSDAESLCQRMAFFRGHRMAKAAVEMAFFDLTAEMKRIPLKKLLGGTRKEVEATLTIGIDEDLKKTAAHIEKGVAQGYRKIKLKVSPSQDIKPLKELRGLFPQAPLSIDANGTFTWKDLARLKALDRLNFLMIEQPFGERALADLAKLRIALKTPVSLDETIESVDDAKAVFELNAAGIINIKPARVGGLTESLQIYKEGLKQRAPMFVGGLLEMGVGRLHALALASLKGFTLPAELSESARYYREDIIEPPVALSPQGTLEVPADKGGVKKRIQMNRVKRYLVSAEIIK